MDELRIKLAELQGYKWYADDTSAYLVYKSGLGLLPKGLEQTSRNELRGQRLIIRYPPLDNNLMDRLVCEMPKDKRASYYVHLVSLVGTQPLQWQTAISLILATVEQKARAYIATMEEK